jgi:hypothetical protein
MSAFRQDGVFQSNPPIFMALGGSDDPGRIAKLNTPADAECWLNGMLISQ